MNLRFIVPIAIFTAVNGFGGLLPFSQARAEDNGEQEETQVSTDRLIPYACYDQAGNVVFTTFNPQETVGWALGCREVQYESTDPISPPIAYFQCFDVNGGVAFNTVDEEVAEESDLFCRTIGSRVTTPVPYRPIYYECYNIDGNLAFTTSYPQNTFGWKPGCRELPSQTVTAQETTETPQNRYECLDISGNVAFTTNDPQEVRRWKLGCREVR